MAKEKTTAPAQAPAPAPAPAQAQAPAPAQAPAQAKKRNTIKLSDRLAGILVDFDALKELTLDNVKAVVTKHLKTASKAVSKAVAPSVDAMGKTIYHCVRSKKWFYLEDMVVNTDGTNRGYSKVSQEVLTQSKADARQASEEGTKALLDGDTEKAIQLVQRAKDIKTAQETGTMYANIVGTATPATPAL